MQGPRNDNAARRKRVYVQSYIIVISASVQWMPSRPYRDKLLQFSSGFLALILVIVLSLSTTICHFHDDQRLIICFQIFCFVLVLKKLSGIIFSSFYNKY